MRKLSCKWPVWSTVFSVALPVFYVLHRIGKPQIFRVEELAEKVVAAVGCTMITWFIYGVACLFARPLRDISKEEPWRPSKDFPALCHKDDDSKVLCKGCGRPLPQAQIKLGLGNPEYNEWNREGYCRFDCFEDNRD